MAAKNTERYLFCFDYDNTIGDTFKPSPNKIGVLQAYEFAIESIFGPLGLKAYNQIGGLQNRAPGELVENLLKNGNRKVLIRNARIFYCENLDWLNSLAEQGKFIVPQWRDTSSDRETEEVISELLILQKLFYLMKEI